MAIEKREAITSVFWKLFEKGGSQAVSLIVQIALARLLSPSDYGALSVMVVFVNVANVFVQSGFATSLIQARDIDEDTVSSVFWLTLAISVLFYVLIWFVSPFIATFYSLPIVCDALRVLSLLIPIGSLTSVFTALISRSMQFKKFFFATIVSVVSSGAVGIALAWSGFGLWALVAQQLVFAFVDCFVLGIQVDWRPHAVFKYSEVKRLFSFGWKLLVSGLLETGYQSLSDLIIGKQFSPSSLGMVSQGKKIPMTLGNVLDGSIQPVMLSAVARVQEEKTYVKRLVRRALKTSTFLIVPAMVLLAVAAEPIVLLLFGEKWLPCVPFFQMYCFIYALLPIHTTNLQALNGVGRSDLFLKLEFIKKSYGICFVVIGAFILKDVYLMIASYMLSGIISTIVNSWPNRSVIGYSYGEQLRDIAPAFVLAILAGTLAFFIGGYVTVPALKIVVESIVVFGVYLGLSAFARVEAFSYLLGTIRNLFGKRAKK